MHFTPIAFDSFEIEKGLENVLLEELLDIPHEEFVTGGGNRDEKLWILIYCWISIHRYFLTVTCLLKMNESYDPLEETILVNSEIFESGSSLTETVSLDQI